MHINALQNAGPPSLFWFPKICPALLMPLGFIHGHPSMKPSGTISASFQKKPERVMQLEPFGVRQGPNPNPAA